MALDNFLDNEKIKKTSEKICEEMEDVLWSMFLDREHKLCLQIRKNKFLFFALARISINRNQQVVCHSVFMTQNQIKVLYENILNGLDNFRRLKHEKESV